MINAATVAEKRPVCRSFFSELTRSRRYEGTHEDEDAIQVAFKFPTLYQRLVLLLTLLEDNGPELRGRIHVLNVCESHMRIQARTELKGELPESFSAVQVGARGTYLGLSKGNRTWKLATFKPGHHV